MDAKELIQLAGEYGLPCIERDHVIFVVGLEHIIEFKTQHDFINLDEETLI